VSIALLLPIGTVPYGTLPHLYIVQTRHLHALASPAKPTLGLPPVKILRRTPSRIFGSTGSHFTSAGGCPFLTESYKIAVPFTLPSSFHSLFFSSPRILSSLPVPSAALTHILFDTLFPEPFGYPNYFLHCRNRLSFCIRKLC
jgi:hypothetical protein